MSTISINNPQPRVGDTIEMTCTLVVNDLNNQAFTQTISSYSVNGVFATANQINSNQGTIGGIDASRLSTQSVSSTDRQRLTGDITMTALTLQDTNTELGCAASFGTNAGDVIRINTTFTVTAATSTSQAPTPTSQGKLKIIRLNVKIK
ncbi:hypothetical protein [Salmonella sp. s54836]|uniref:hypothetical protein n=1 Tax=Salmonella sp. s54836 TaxID=3159673 RepID=UPI00397F2573